ncbi:hypothetical protein A0O36_02606 [Piscirickettsiaceae bacterium NZ-RLO1]|nr:hypothetical protein A0O36_02606 [Piscirickettsiaceae bacterium NZ-RLO1]
MDISSALALLNVLYYFLNLLNLYIINFYKNEKTVINANN